MVVLKNINPFIIPLISLSFQYEKIFLRYLQPCCTTGNCTASKNYKKYSTGYEQDRY